MRTADTDNPHLPCALTGHVLAYNGDMRLFNIKPKQDQKTDSPRFVDIGYPPSPQGFPVEPVENLLRSPSTMELIKRFRDAMPFKDTLFDAMVVPTLLKFMETVHLIPASEDNHHRFCGGLLAHSLETACYSAQFSNARVFERTADPELKREREPRWHAAAGIAGLLHDVGKIANVRVVNADGSEVWDFSKEISLLKWARAHEITAYYVTWLPDRVYEEHDRLGASMFDVFVMKDLRAWLGLNMRLQITDAILNRPNAILGEFANRADRTSCERDLDVRSQVSDDNRRGVRVEQYILKIFVQLVSERVWTTNIKGSRVWYVQINERETGLFIAWAKGYEEVISRVMEQQIPAVPRGMDKLARFLVEDCRVAEPYIDSVGEVHNLWLMTVPGAAGGKTVNLKCLRLKTGAHLFSTMSLPSPIQATVMDLASSEPAPPDGGERSKAVTKSPQGKWEAIGPEMSLPEAVQAFLDKPPVDNPEITSVHEDVPIPNDDDPLVGEPAGPERFETSDVELPQEPRRSPVEPKSIERPNVELVDGNGKVSKGEGVVSEKVQAARKLLGFNSSIADLARERLSKMGDAGRLLHELVERSSGKWSSTPVLVRKASDVVISYPSGLRSLVGWKKMDGTAVTEVGGFIGILADKRCLHVDPMQPRQFVRTVGDQSGLLLTPEAAALVTAILDAIQEAEASVRLVAAGGKTVITGADRPADLESVTQSKSKQSIAQASRRPSADDQPYLPNIPPAPKKRAKKVNKFTSPPLWDFDAVLDELFEAGQVNGDTSRVTRGMLVDQSIRVGMSHIKIHSLFMKSERVTQLEDGVYSLKRKG